MEDDTYVRKLAELIFSEQFKNTEEMSSSDLSITTCLLTNDFSRKIHDVLYVKQTVLESEWQDTVILFSKIILDSHYFYLTSVMFACVTEYESNQNVFESFISVCALLICMNDGIFNITGIDVSNLNTDVFMVFYDSVVKMTFSKHGGFRRFIEYINGHRYLIWKWKYLVTSDDSTYVTIQEDIKKKIEIEVGKRDYQLTDDELQFRNATSIFLAQKVLSTTSAKLPIVPSNPNVIKCLATSRNEEIEKDEREKVVKTTARFEDSDGTHGGYSSSNSDSRTDHSVNQNGDNTRYENIIQAAIRHNHSRNSGHTNSNNHIQKEANRLLDHLKDTIKSLTTVLDENDNE